MRDTGAVASKVHVVEPHDPAQFAAFARFFKAYMGTASIVTASLPIPVAAFHLIPTYGAQEKYLSTYTSMFCFLMLAYFFYIRHWLGRLMFYSKPDGEVAVRRLISFVPLLLILTSFGLVYLYHHYLAESLGILTDQGLFSTTNDALKRMDYREIPYSVALTVYYVGMFVTAEAAFILMALREYLQGVLKISDTSLIRLRQSK